MSCIAFAMVMFLVVDSRWESLSGRPAAATCAQDTLMTDRTHPVPAAAFVEPRCIDQRVEAFPDARAGSSPSSDQRFQSIGASSYADRRPSLSGR